MTASLVPLLVLLVVYTPQAVVLACLDGATHRLPNRHVAALTVSVGGAMALVSAATPGLGARFIDSVVLGLLLGAAAILLALIAPGALGMGDAKSLPVVVVMSAVLGAEVLIAGALAAALLAAVLGAAVLAATRNRAARIPVGPVLLAVPHLGLLGGPLLARTLGIA